jgi:hypothetical protein
MTLFLTIGAAGAVLLVVATLFDGVIDLFDLGDGLLSGPAIASFVGAFGFAGALALSAGFAPVLAVGVGTAAGAAVGALAGLAARSLMRMPTDATVSSGSYVGLSGTVVTSIGAGSLGEVSVIVAGQPVKMSARSKDGAPIGAGETVTVQAVPSPTLVLVSASSDAASPDAVAGGSSTPPSTPIATKE